MRKHLLLVLLILVSIGWLCPQAEAREVHQSSPRLLCLKTWHRMVATPLMHPMLSKATLLIPANIQLGGRSPLMNLILNNEQVGSVGMTNNYKEVLLISLDKHNYVEGVKSIDQNKARIIAEMYIKNIYHNTLGSLSTRFKRRSEKGDYCFICEYVYKDVMIRSIEVNVSYDGYIDYIGDFYILRDFKKDIHKEITPSPGEADIRAVCRKYMKSHGLDDAKIISIKRVIDLKKGKERQTVDIFWFCEIERETQGHHYIAAISYNEKNKKFTLSNWDERL